MRPLQRIALSILFYSILTYPAHAEQTPLPSLEVGGRTAYSRVTFFRGGGVQRASTLKYASGFAFGISSHYRLYTANRIHLGVQPDLLFVRRGADLEYENLIISTFQLNYVEVPILGRALFPLSESVSPYVVGGPRFGLLLSAESTDVNGNVRDESDGTNTFDVGFSAGAGALIRLRSRMMLTIEGRYDQSLMNRLDFDGEEVTNDQRHRAFFLMLGVSMGIGSPTHTSVP